MSLPAAKTRNQSQTYFHNTFRATITADALIRDYQELGQWQRVAEKHKVSHAYIIKARHWLGIFYKTLTQGKQYGGLHSSATKNGGKNVDNKGYVIVGRYHPSNSKGYRVAEHTLVMEQHLGRSLKPGEAVHHVNGIKHDNRVSNLYLTNHSGHRKVERSLMSAAYTLLLSGKIEFDPIKGEYYAK